MPRPRPKWSAYNFFMKACREEYEMNFPGMPIIYSEFSKVISARWKDLAEPGKSYYRELSDNDKIRYEEEMLNYVDDPQSVPKTIKRKRPKATKDPNAPKHPLSSYFWFSHYERDNVRAQNPGISVPDVGRELGRRWQNLDPTSKAAYEELARRDRERYGIEVQRYCMTKNELGQLDSVKVEDGDVIGEEGSNSN